MIRCVLVAVLAVVFAAPATAAPVTFDFARVGNPGNEADWRTGLGGVDYTYAIGKHEVTNAQYAAFLNAVDPTAANALALYNPLMAGPRSGIAKSGQTDGARYVALPDQEQKPVTYVSFFDAMRFVNWLHNGQGAGDTEAGVYVISNGIEEVRSPNAKFWIPNEDEWYKAAYHDASAGTAGVYFDYATGSNEEPISDRPEDNPAAVNYANDDGLDNGFNDGYAVWDGRSYPTTDVGAYTEAASPYGTFDQNGNVIEWNASLFHSSLRGSRGGTWSATSASLLPTTGGAGSPTLEGGLRGFRIATVPEPRSWLFAAFGAISWISRRSTGGPSFAAPKFDPSPAAKTPDADRPRVSDNGRLLHGPGPTQGVAKTGGGLLSKAWTKVTKVPAWAVCGSPPGRGGPGRG